MSAVENALPQAAAPEDHAADGGSGPDKPQNLLYQQQEAQRIARQLLNRPLSQTGQMAPPPQPQQQFILQQQYHDAAARGGGPPQRMLPTYGYAYPPSTFFQNQLEGVAMPPLQGALQQELPTSLSGDVMRPGPMLSVGAANGNGTHPADEYLVSVGAAPANGAAKPSEEPNAKTPKRSSRFRGVTRHRRSGRWEAHIWVKASGKQVYLGGYELEEHAAEAYDVAAIKCKGPKVKTNFPLEKYRELMRFMDTISLEELVMAVRRQSQGFARGSSGFRGVTHHPNGRWEARIGMPGSKHIYLGLFNEEQMAAQAYDRALVKLRGPAAATNFALSEYKPELQEYYRRIEVQKEEDVDIAALLKTDLRKQSPGKDAAKQPTGGKGNASSEAAVNKAAT